MENIFDWNDQGDVDVVIPTTQGVAVYISEAGYLVIRQQGAMGEDDAVVTINSRDIDRFMIAVGNVKGD